LQYYNLSHAWKRRIKTFGKARIYYLKSVIIILTKWSSINDNLCYYDKVVFYANASIISKDS